MDQVTTFYVAAKTLTPALSQRERERRRLSQRERRKMRRGVAALDYILVLGVLLPLIVFIMWAGPRMMRLAYEMLCVLVSWPFV